MNAPFLVSFAFGVWLVAPAASIAAETKKACDTGQQQEKLVKQATIFAALQTSLFTDNCGATQRVMKMITGELKAGGRKLKPLSGPDLDNARREYAKAQADPQFNSDLKTAASRFSDPVSRKIAEAALLEEHGYYEARAILVQELRDAGGIKE